MVAFVAAVRENRLFDRKALRVSWEGSLFLLPVAQSEVAWGRLTLSFLLSLSNKEFRTSSTPSFVSGVPIAFKAFGYNCVALQLGRRISRGVHSRFSHALFGLPGFVFRWCVRACFNCVSLLP